MDGNIISHLVISTQTVKVDGLMLKIFVRRTERISRKLPAGKNKILSLALVFINLFKSGSVCGRKDPQENSLGQTDRHLAILLSGQRVSPLQILTFVRK